MENYSQRIVQKGIIALSSTNIDFFKKLVLIGQDEEHFSGNYGRILDQTIRSRDQRDEQGVEEKCLICR
ncbi:hypothetical protein TNCV_4709681 [Trichonephila clavipes]|nr:hypothetical protein TNCV_4709681 [Trichonephila clavipes]